MKNILTMNTRGIFIYLLALWSFSLVGQRSFTQMADEKFELKKYFEAIELYKKAYTKVNDKVEKNRILYQIGVSYYMMSDMKNAAQYFKRVVKVNYPEPNAYYLYGEALKSLEKYEEALIAFQEMKQKYPDDKRADQGIESCKLAKAWMDNPTQYEVSPDKKINSKYLDFAPAWYDKKHRSIVFTTSREEVIGKGTDAWTGQAFTDLFVTTQDKKGNWSTPVPIDEEGVINTPDNEGACVLNSKYNTIYFTRCKKEKKKILGCQIYISTKKGKAWSEPELLQVTSDSSVSVRHPAVNDDETMIIFSSDMPGGQGGYDLWMMTRSKKNKPFENPVNLGSVINTSGDEVFPTLREVNGRTFLYFSSNGHLGMGGLDIFVSEYMNGSWTEPVNMKYPINSSGDDFHMIFNDDPNDLAAAKAKEMGWFTTNRKGGKGSDDLWQFKLPPLLFTLSGVVYDDSTKQVIPEAEVTIEGSNGTIYKTKTDKGGRYNFDNKQILENTTYDIFVSKDNYFNDKSRVTTIGLQQSKDLVQDFYLVPIPQKPIVLPEIRYDFDDWKLLPQYQDSLRGLVQLMKENPNIVVELGSHTDARGSDVYNDTLSFKRAKSCVDFIISQGIEADRLIPKGYGKRVPRVLEKDITITYNNKTFTFKKGTVLTEAYINSLPSKDEQEAAHQLNRRTTFQIVRTDYVPKGEKNKPVPEIQIIKE